jgi:OOP family OmpA-OmpF porin
MFFEFNDSLIRKENISRIDSICSILNNQEFDSILISGHTDSIGDADYNLKLSKARANSIAYYLIDCGIRMDKLNVIGYGETRLLDNFDGDDSRNRRVEIEIFNNE